MTIRIRSVPDYNTRTLGVVDERRAHVARPTLEQVFEIRLA
jgi:hypothetical protein